MNEQAILHVPDSRFCFATKMDELVLRLRTDKNDKLKVNLISACKYDFALKREITELEIKYTDRYFNYYEIKLKLNDVRFAYVFEIIENENIYYYSEDGITESYNFELGFYNFFQMPYINKNDVMKTVDWMRNAVFYQIFVERFNRGIEDKTDGYINMKWGDLPTPKSFAGGDIPGITKKLDYLKDLGINVLYLTPIFKSISNHKYDIIDYKLVDEQFGTNEDFKELVEKAHKKGIKIVLDAVFNHCSMLSDKFQDVIRNGRDSKYYDWFIVYDDKVDVKRCNYECFAACNYMPKWNTSNKEVQEFLLDVALYWIKEYKIDGWRLDVSDEVSHDFWKKFRSAVKEYNEDVVIIGENWHDAYPYLQGDEYDSIMNYSFTKACLDFFAFNKFSAKDLSCKLNEILMRNTEQVNSMMLNLLDSHDTHRFYTETGKNRNKVLAAIALEMVFPGAPSIYYGTEILMEGGYDPDSRRCFDWNEKHHDKEVLGKIKELIKLRNMEEVMYGDIKIWSRDDILYLARKHNEKTLIFAMNFSGKDKQINLLNEYTNVYDINQNKVSDRTDTYSSMEILLESIKHRENSLVDSYILCNEGFVFANV